MSETAIQEIVSMVQASPKYRTVSPAFIERLARQELRKGRNAKEASKAVKNKLHQVAGAYLDHPPDYTAWLEELRQAAQSPRPADLRSACRRMLRLHASTRERLGILDEFYTRCLDGLPPLRSILDVACGLNPLAIPWMNLAPGAEYYAVDIYTDLSGFLNQAWGIFGVKGQAWTMDVVESRPVLEQTVDIAFILKAIPCLEQVEKTAGARLLESVRARRLLVSFPGHSLGGRHKGMPEAYSSLFSQLAAGKDWTIQRYEFASELVFRVDVNVEDL